MAGQMAAQLDKMAGQMAAQLDQTAAESAKAVESAKVAQRDEAATQAAQVAAQLDMIRERVEGLQSRLEFQARLDGRMRDLEIGLVTNKRAIQAIYNSRIWKTLCSLGGVVLRLTGRRAEPDAGNWAPRGEAAAAPAAPPEPGAAGDFLALICDNPRDGDVLPVRDVVEIRGWTLAESGIDRVLIQINGDPPVPAAYGILRPDVARGHPGVSGAGQSGFRFFWDPTGMPEGACTVRVTAVARSGQTREVISNVLIDWQTPPGYSLWIARNEPGVEDLRRMRREAADFAAARMHQHCSPGISNSDLPAYPLHRVGDRARLTQPGNYVWPTMARMKQRSPDYWSNTQNATRASGSSRCRKTAESPARRMPR